jgi:deoxycytidylate deaminase
MYEDSFILIGVVCEEEKRINRITNKFADCGRESAKTFMERDADAVQVYGQHVSDAFHMSDYFIDNTVDQYLRQTEPNPNWDINEKLSRLVKIVTHDELVRPMIGETAMYHAYSSKMQSACLSRQVGAALVDSKGNVIATGTNEVPKAGGGVYGESFEKDVFEGRCALFADTSKRFCSNTREQNAIISDVIDKIDELRTSSPARRAILPMALRKTRIGELLAGC